MRLGRHEFADDQRLVMAIVNRTPDSFYDRGRTFAEEHALDAAAAAVRAGAQIIDIGGVKAGPGDEVSVDEEITRTAPIVKALRDAHPGVVISVDTWRHEVGEVVCEAGADLLNDAWGGFDPELARVAGECGVALVCTHAGGATPRTRPHRVEYEDVVADVSGFLAAEVQRAVALGVAPESILIDPGHDFGKNTWHSLAVTRELRQLVDIGMPVLVSLSNKDFIGESLDAPVDARLVGTLATTAITAWLGARVFRVHEPHETRQVLQMVQAIEGSAPPAVARRGLA